MMTFAFFHSFSLDWALAIADKGFFMKHLCSRKKNYHFTSCCHSVSWGTKYLSLGMCLLNLLGDNLELRRRKQK